MKLKLDENIPLQARTPLEGLGHDVHTTQDEGLGGASDEEVWRAAQREARLLVTQDLDYSDVRRFALGTHSGILLLRLRVPAKDDLARRLVEIFQSQDPENWSRCLVVATERKMRIIRPTGA
ncbi:MAG: DUF5615 family PIN-like protein [Candidatus Acidiferrales bacterium]